MTPPDPLIGALFDGRYKVLKKLGSGGMATVYLAEDQELGRRVAIKILNAKHASDEQFVERFRREASSAAGLSHPNIVQIYDRGKAEGTYYIAMEVIEGLSLKELIIKHGPSPIPVAVNYGRQILAALRFAHRNGVVHRDIKPHNVLVDEEGRVKVTDFGIARAGASEMTEVGSIIGTAQYLSPEQARGAPVDARSDLYSVGVVLYELLTGEAPYNGDTPVEIAMKHLSAVPEPPSVKRPEVPPELDAVVLRALAKNPDDRFQSVEEMDADLNAISKGMEISETTTDAATTVLAGAGLSAPTMISRAPTRVVPPSRTGAPMPPPTPPDYYDYDRNRRGRWTLGRGDGGCCGCGSHHGLLRSGRGHTCPGICYRRCAQEEFQRSATHWARRRVGSLQSGDRRGERVGWQPVGCLYHWKHHPDCHRDGPVDVPQPRHAAQNAHGQLF